MYLIKVCNFYLKLFFPSNMDMCKEIRGKYFDCIHFIACFISLNAADLYVQCMNGRAVKPCRIEK